MRVGMRVRQTDWFAAHTWWASLYGPKTPLEGVIDRLEGPVAWVHWDGRGYAVTEFVANIEPIADAQIAIVFGTEVLA